MTVPATAALSVLALAAAITGAVALGCLADEAMPGGGATSLKPRNANAFSQSSANLPAEQLLAFRVGDGIFRKQWVSAPSSTHSSDGLGPLFNARATGSVAVQGLSALERALFEPEERKQLATEPYRCQWLAAITTNLAAMARETLAEWTGPPQDYAVHFIAADGNGSQYQAPSEATLELFKSLYAAVELVADHKLARPMADKPATSRPRLAESWRSETSLANVKANLEAARDLYASLAPGVADAALRQDMPQRFAAVVAAADAVRGPLETAIADAARRPAVEKLRREASMLKRVLADKLAPALGLQVGFNALDGD